MKKKIIHVRYKRGNLRPRNYVKRIDPSYTSSAAIYISVLVVIIFALS